MAVTIQPLIQSQPIAAAMSNYFTASGFTRIDAMTLYNPVGNAAEFVTIEWVKNGSSPGNPQMIASHNCLPGETFTVFGFIGHTMAPGDKIYARGTAGALVNLFASGTVSS